MSTVTWLQLSRRLLVSRLARRARSVKMRRARERRRPKRKRNRTEYHRNYRRQRQARDPAFRTLLLLRRRLRHAVKSQGTKKSSSTLNLAGCSPQKLRYHLESQFTDGMSWDNQGKWHIDHIRPCKSFDLTDPEQQRKCFHYTNLQPLWAIDNLRKGARFTARLTPPGTSV